MSLATEPRNTKEGIEVGSKLNHKKEKQGRMRGPNDLMSDDIEKVQTTLPDPRRTRET